MTEQRNEWAPPSEHGWPVTSVRGSRVFEGDPTEIGDEVGRQTRRLLDELIRGNVLLGQRGVQISFAVDFREKDTEVMGVAWVNGAEPPPNARNEFIDRIDVAQWHLEGIRDDLNGQS